MSPTKESSPEVLPPETQNDKERPLSLPRLGVNSLRLRGRGILRGFAVREAVMVLKCTTYMSMAEIAKEVGRTQSYCHRIWKLCVRDAQEMSVDPARKSEMKTWLIEQLRMTIVTAQNKVEDHAAYGALVIKGVEQMAQMIGLDKEDMLNDKYSTKEIADRLDTKSPLVLAKLGKVKDLESAERVAKEM